MTRLEKFQTLCNDRGISINRLEQEIGVSQGSLRKIDTNMPKADKIFALAQYFQVPMEYFFEETHKERPLYRASAGQGAYNETYTSESVSMGEEGYEYATVVGDSMLPELRDGDIIKIEPTAETSPKDYTLIKIDGDDCTIKFVEIVESGIWVRALNKEVFEDRFYSIQDVLTLPITIVGRAVALRRDL